MCRPAVCPEGQSVRVLRKGNGQPGSCCDQWTCEAANLVSRRVHQRIFFQLICSTFESIKTFVEDTLDFSSRVVKSASRGTSNNEAKNREDKNGRWCYILLLMFMLPK